MINEFTQAISDKTKDQYKIIENKYEILKRYIKIYFDNHSLMSKEDAELILKSLDDEKEEETNE